jgi:glyoxylase-like metal-dependent hydrolase (beta-lactamase superfamily II)
VVAGPEGILLIDDQFAELNAKIRDAVSKLNGEPIRFVLNTHWHGDHTGGNEMFAKAGATVVAHENARRIMTTAHKNELFGWSNEASPPRALPVVTFDDSVRFHVNDQEIICFHVPHAHTDGDVMVWMPKSNVLHMGDCLFNGNYPILDLSSGGSLDGMIAAAERALRTVRDDTKIIPGHGPLATKADLQAYRDMLVQSRDRVRKLVGEKKTLDQIVAAKPLADLDEKWGKGGMKPDMWLKVLHTDMVASKQ